MHASVVRFHIGVGAFIGILVLRPELRIAGSDQLARDACGVINPGYFAPSRLRLKVLASGIKIGPVAMACHRHVCQVLIHQPGCEHECPVDGRTLGLVNGRSIAVIDIAIAVFADDDIPAIIETDR